MREVPWVNKQISEAYKFAYKYMSSSIPQNFVFGLFITSKPKGQELKT